MKKYMVENIMVFPLKNTASGEMRRQIHMLAIGDNITEAMDKLKANGIKYRINNHGFFTVVVPNYGERELLRKLGVYERFGATE